MKHWIVEIKAYINNILDTLHMRYFARVVYEYIKYCTNSELRRYNRKFRKHGASDMLPIQPAYLVYIVCNQYDIEAFYYNGMRGMTWLLKILKSNGIRLTDKNTILDFGCGCGRILRFWKNFPENDVYGVDYNKQLIKWCSRNLDTCGLSTNSEDGVLSYSDNMFNVIYAISVFTHMTLDTQIRWLHELYRVLAPDGILVVTTIGPSRINVLTDQQKQIFNSGKIVIRESLYSGTNICGAYHPQGSLKELVPTGLIEVSYIADGATDAAQDINVYVKHHISNEI